MEELKVCVSIWNACKEVELKTVNVGLLHQYIVLFLMLHKIKKYKKIVHVHRLYSRSSLIYTIPYTLLLYKMLKK